jgi:hypothetical protein
MSLMENKVLMPYPHAENNAQNTFTILLDKVLSTKTKISVASRNYC